MALKSRADFNPHPQKDGTFLGQRECAAPHGMSARLFLKQN